MAAAPRSERRPVLELAFQDDDDDNGVDDVVAAVTKVGMPPTGSGAKVLLHSCCAPCSGAMIEEMVKAGLTITIFFYNPNIHPRAEYEIRKEENKRYALKLGIPFVDADYDSAEWFRRARGLEFEPERGARCTMCFDMRLERTALYAFEQGFDCFTTTNATSRWKDQEQVNSSGERAAAKYPGVRYWRYDWQTDAMTRRKYEISAAERFYKQEYCGCSYSLRDSNIYRQQQGQDPIKIGTHWFTDPVADEADESPELVEAFFKQAQQEFQAHNKRNLYTARKKRADGVGDNNW